MNPTFKPVVLFLVFALAIAFSQVAKAQTYGWSSQAPTRASKRISPNLKVQNPIRFTSNPTAIQESDDTSVEQDEMSKIDLLQDRDDKEMDDLDLDLDDDLDDLDDELDDDEKLPARPVFGPWPKKGIRGIGIDIREKNLNAPEDVSSQLVNGSASNWNQFVPAPKVFAWAAPDIRYQPLYFEDVALERYGQTAPPYQQSLSSGFHFFKSFVTLPRQMIIDHPKSCDHPLGFCRPGNKTPYTVQRHWFSK